MSKLKGKGQHIKRQWSTNYKSKFNRLKGKGQQIKRQRSTNYTGI